MPPNILADLIEEEIVKRMDMDQWTEDKKEEDEGKWILAQMSDNFSAIQRFLNPDESITEGWIFE